MTLRVASLLLWPVLAIGRFFIFLAVVTAKPTQPRRAISDVFRFIGSTFTNGGWLWVFDLSRPSGTSNTRLRSSDARDGER